MRFLLFVLSIVATGCFFDSSSSGAPSDLRDGGSDASQGGGKSGGKLPRLRPDAGGTDARVRLEDSGDSSDDDGGAPIELGDASSSNVDGAMPAGDASMPPAPDSGGAGAPAEDAAMPSGPGEGMTCSPCDSSADCAPDYECRAPGRCMIQVQHCEDIASGLFPELDGDGRSRWCLPQYAIEVQHLSIDDACDAWLEKH